MRRCAHLVLHKAKDRHRQPFANWPDSPGMIMTGRSFWVQHPTTVESL